MEQKIVKALDFKLTVPTGYVFLVRYLRVTKASELTRAVANYYMERTLQDYEFIQYRPSLVASAAVCLALNNPQIRIEEKSTGQKPGIVSITYCAVIICVLSLTLICRRMILLSTRGTPETRYIQSLVRLLRLLEQKL
jgi:hypothetical protein